ncbi:MAG: flagellar export protein FliJ [Candidatus Sericytochromatia bacterium]|nr:flagellar export protein FliJ [Candidatus Sericytochromatia bacterium]
MKRFVFRYRTLLEVREREQRREEGQLSQLLAAQADALRDVERTENEARQQRASFGQHLQGRVDLDTVHMMHGCLEAQERLIQMARDAYDAACARTENQREVLLKAVQAVEVLNKLKERDLNHWRSALEAAEAAALDELATLRYTRPAF